MSGSFLKSLRVEDSVETRRRRFFAKARRVGIGFCVIGLLGAGETLWFLWRGIPWRDARGAVIPRHEMLAGALIFLGTAVFGAVMLWVVKRHSNR